MWKCRITKITDHMIMLLGSCDLYYCECDNQILHSKFVIFAVRNISSNRRSLCNFGMSCIDDETAILNLLLCIDSRCTVCIYPAR